MALDMRRPNNWKCRKWLERVLVTLESRGVLEATYERRPPHYHIAVFPKQYADYVEHFAENPQVATYLVSRGDTLSRIARQHKTSVETVKLFNGLRSDRIYPGQLLEVPVDD
jgi:nucleoid-associated protein YgaU